MQSLVPPIGHGSTHNSFRADDDLRATETTPLVRFPGPREPSTSWSVRSNFAFGLLVLLLMAGSAIGIYLLYLQSLSDNVLPPVDTPLLFVSRKQWCNLPARKTTFAKLPNTPSKHIVVVQTGTAACYDIHACSELLKNLQEKNGEPLPYNFLVSSNGVTFEGLGWESRSPMFSNLSAIVVAFIGNFTYETPTTSQLEEAFTLFDASNLEGRLTRGFTIVGKITRPGHVPTYLFDSLQNLTQWDKVLSDDY